MCQVTEKSPDKKERYSAHEQGFVCGRLCRPRSIFRDELSFVGAYASVARRQILFVGAVSKTGFSGFKSFELILWIELAKAICLSRRKNHVFKPLKNGEITLLLTTNRWYVVKSVSQKRN